MMLWSAAAPAPNPRRVTIFLAEKGVTIPTTDLAIFKGEHKAPAFVEKNPRGQVPAFELDDGTVIAESISICRYFDALYPEPPLFGTDPLDRALVDMALRRVETVLGIPLSMV
ncbi:glutathione S-transferase N-terminal domain-containing protein [Glacieibacterium megasporae]|uniref:glutathione S-transferase N-terminal domain-containing protein n=1 Tax=Glacieibacterium megasporae TaxID=2835787 RepID=UPI001C1E57B7|nr:glutathione S-transferase N-terminal domain-containing protein [Polymorphobacter megasporae]UAJ10893.1 glutathione S-transferase N-terminal domain-containing protein [Polymorphobacter megasporae]